MASEASLRELLTDEVRDLYNAEKQLVKALPKMAKAATSDELREAFESHLEETENQVGRLEQAFKLLGEQPRGKHCAGIAGIIEEGTNLMDEEFDGSVLDAGLIAGGQRAEHYEIAAYGSVLAWAKTLGMDELIALLKPTLEEEKAADEKLSQLAESSVNSAAAAGSDSEEAEDDEAEGEDEAGGEEGRSSGRAGSGTRRGGMSASSGRSTTSRGSNGGNRPAASRSQSNGGRSQSSGSRTGSNGRSRSKGR